jgi:hypothetical protein
MIRSLSYVNRKIVLLKTVLGGSQILLKVGKSLMKTSWSKEAEASS